MYTDDNCNLTMYLTNLRTGISESPEVTGRFSKKQNMNQVTSSLGLVSSSLGLHKSFFGIAMTGLPQFILILLDLNLFPRFFVLWDSNLFA